MHWILLIIAGLFETAFAICLGKTNEVSGKESIPWWIGFIVFLAISMILLSIAVQKIPIGTAYAVWTGIGAVGTFVIGILFFKDSASLMRVFSAGLIIIGVVGLKFFG